MTNVPERSETALRGVGVSIAVYLHDGFTSIVHGRINAPGARLDTEASTLAVAGALTTIVAHMLDVAKRDPELGEWMRYQLLADVPPDGQLAQTQHNIRALRAIRLESEAAS